MAKNVFRNGEFQYNKHRVYLEPPHTHKRVRVAEERPSLERVEEYNGPTADDLRREAEHFKKNWDAERERMILNAHEEAKRILEEAEEKAFEQIKDKQETAQRLKQDSEREGERIVAQARAEAEQIVKEAQQRATTIEQEAFERGRREGEQEGIEEGKREVQRVIERFHVVLSKAIERRNEIIEESETQVISLVLSIAKKVIKVISENQKNIVINNIVQSLQKLKAKSDVIVRVNLSDLEISAKHKEDILRMAERVKSITIAEDSTVDPGGCIIETDFGEIDARISSQLREIEDRIVELVPIKTRKAASVSAD